MAEVVKLASSLDASCLGGCSCAIGVFDGIHRGHRFIIDQTIATAQRTGAPSAILTFNPDPDELFCAGTLKKLMSNDARISCLSSCGVDIVAVVPFDARVASIDAAAFLNACFAGLPPSSFHVGSDFRFGAHALGGIEDLRTWGQAHGVDVDACDLLMSGGEPITSSRIRSVLEQGDVEGAVDLLGHAYVLSQTIVAGRGEGAQLGFPTANLHIDDALLVPEPGVYAAWARLGATCYPAAVSVGIPPTFQDRAQANMEVHLIDFDGKRDIRGFVIDVALARRLRSMRAYDDLVELKRAIEGDIDTTRELLRGLCPPWEEDGGAIR